MNILENKTVEFMKELELCYLVLRDLDAILEKLDDNFRWISARGEAICGGKDVARNHLREEMDMMFNPVTILESRHEAYAVTDNVCLSQVFLSLGGKREDVHIPAIDIRISAVCVRREEGIKLFSLHMSKPNMALESSGFPSPMLANTDMEMLRKLVESQSNTLRDKVRNLNALTDNLPGGVLCCDYTDELNIIQYSEGFLKMFGYNKDEIKSLFHNHFAEMIYKEDLAASWDIVRRQLQISDTKQIEYRIYHKDGRLLTILDRGQLVTNTSGQQVFYCFLMDITESKKATEELRLSLERYQIIMDQTEDILFEWDVINDGISFSQNWEKKFGYPSSVKRVKQDLFTLGHCHPADHIILQDMIDSILNGKKYLEEEIRIMHGDRRYIWCKVRVTPQRNDQGLVSRAIGVIIDIDEQKKEKQVLIRQAERDPLTGLYNKGAAHRLAERQVKMCTSDQMCALMMIDVDNFKQVNDVYGHLTGDDMLIDIAASLRSMFRETDVVGRVGGDEFAVLMIGLADTDIVEEKAKKILNIFHHMIFRQNDQSQLSASIGIAIAPQDGTTFLTLFQNADLALYYAKSQGKNQYAFYTKFMTMETSLHSHKNRRKTDVKNQKETNNVKTWILEYVFHTLYQSSDFEKALTAILEIVGSQFDVSRVYVFEDYQDKTDCCNTFEWCSSQCLPAKDSFSSIGDRTKMEEYYRFFDEKGIFYCKDVSKLPDYPRRMFEQQNIKAILQCAIRDRGINKGFVGFDECRNNRFWTQDQISALSMFSEIISVFLLKNRTHNHMERMEDTLSH